MQTVQSMWLVDFDRDALADLEKVKARGDRRALFAAIDKLQSLGPRLTSPNMKSLKGEPDLFELRPKRGACAIRLIYAREGRRFVVLAIAPSKERFGRALREARQRLDRRRTNR